jgi:hypothetical protein
MPIIHAIPIARDLSVAKKGNAGIQNGKSRISRQLSFTDIQRGVAGTSGPGSYH